MQFVAQVFLQPFDLVVGDVCRPVQLAGAVALQFGVFVFADVVDDFVELYVLRAVVVGRFFEDDARLWLPFAHFVGAVAGNVFGARPFFAVFFHDMPRHGVGDGVDEQAGEVGGGVVQFDDEGFVVRRADAERIQRLFAFDDFFCVFDRIEEEAVFAADRRIDAAPPGIDEVACGDGGAVRPGVVAQVEGVGFAVFRDVPFFGDAGDEVRARVFVDEADEHVAQDVHFRHALRQLRVHAGGFGVVAAAQDVFSLRAAGGGEQEGGE